MRETLPSSTTGDLSSVGALTESAVQKPLEDRFRAAFSLRKPLLINGFSRFNVVVVSVESELEHG